MATASPPEKVYNFDEPFFAYFKIKFLYRKSPSSPFEIQHIKLMWLAALSLILYFLCFLMKIVEYFRGTHLELGEIGQVAALGSVYIISFNRAFTLLAHKQTVNGLLKNLEKLFPVTRDEQIKYQMHRFAETIIRKNKIMKTLCSYGSIAFYSMPILRSLYDYVLGGRPYIYRYPFITWHPFDDKTLYTYPFVYLIQMASSLIGVFFLLNEDLIFTTSVTHMCMHYWHLSDLLSKLEAKFESRTRQQIKVLVKYQYELENLRKEVDEIFSLSTFIGFTIMKASLCMFMFSMFHGVDITDIIPNILAFLALLIPVYLRCSIGTDLHEASASLIESIYDHNWYEGTYNHRKVVTLMMIRANRPVLLQASRVNLISLEYFMEVLSFRHNN